MCVYIGMHTLVGLWKPLTLQQNSVVPGTCIYTGDVITSGDTGSGRGAGRDWGELGHVSHYSFLWATGTGGHVEVEMEIVTT